MDDVSNLETAIIERSGVQFALFDSAYPSRMPIVMSSDTTLKLLGAEYVVWKSGAEWTRQLNRLRGVFGTSRMATITLKSPTLLPATDDNEGEDEIASKNSSDHGGQLLFIFAADESEVDVPLVQEALNIHAQDIHNSYASKKWGELAISIGRIISKCG